MEEKIIVDAQKEKIIDKDYETTGKRSIFNINYILKEENKYKNISYTLYEKLEENNGEKINIIKILLKILRFLYDYIFHKSIKWILEGCRLFENFYESYIFFENILFCILSIFDIIAITFYKNDFSLSFFIIRIISDILGIFVFGISIILWNNVLCNKKIFEARFLFFTLIGLSLMSLFDIFSFVIFCSSNSDFNIIVIMCFLIHLILCIAIFSIIFCKYLS